MSGTDCQKYVDQSRNKHQQSTGNGNQKADQRRLQGRQRKLVTQRSCQQDNQCQNGADQPAFVAVLPLRADAPNGSEYGASEAWPAEKLAETTLTAYPDLAPVITDMSIEEAVARAEETLIEMGLEIVDVSAADGRVEATATTFWFGFKDDMVIRVRPDTGGVRLDVRSMSRVGQSDVGANAARIMRFVEMF